ncbi:MAG: hypothetical protein PHQ23_13730 [Candidatus Wallbacteria bacterium]|nr:hypothetical protein [Candidatus Wallbacteria bacterium]
MNYRMECEKIMRAFPEAALQGRIGVVVALFNACRFNDVIAEAEKLLGIAGIYEEGLRYVIDKARGYRDSKDERVRKTISLVSQGGAQ